MTLLRLAWRNVWRQRRRTLLLSLVVVYVTVAVLFMLGFLDGYGESLVESYAAYVEAPVVVAPRAFFEDPDPENGLKRPFQVDHPKVLAQSPRLSLPALLRSPYRSLGGTLLEGVYLLRVERPGLEKVYRLKVYTDGERAYFRVLEPKGEAGLAYLSLGQDLYLYDPRLGRTLRLPPSARGERFLGSDLTYQDLMGRDLERLFEVSEAEEALVLTPRPGAPTPYGKVEVYLKGGFLERVLYYDQRGQAVRELLLKEYQALSGGVLPREMELKDLLRPGYRTLVQILEVRAGPVPERCFSPLYLERGC